MIFSIALLGPGNEISYLRKVAFAVLVELCDPTSSYNSSVATGYDKTIADILVYLCPLNTNPNTTMSGAGAGASAVVTRMLSFIVDQCQPWCTNAVNTALQLHRAKNILKSLHSASNQHEISLGIIEFIQLGHVPEWWDSEVTFPLSLQDGEAGNCIGEEVCSRSLDLHRFELASSFSSLLLTAAWNFSKPLQQPETCQRLLNRLRGSSMRQSMLLCSYNTQKIMGLVDDGALIEVQIECKELQIRLANEQERRVVLEEQLAESEKLLMEEREACEAVQQYLESAEREGFQTSQALRSAREDYAELLADADRKVDALQLQWKDEELFLRADYLRREDELEEQVDEKRSMLVQREQELELEKQQRAELVREMEAALAKSNVEGSGDRHRD